ncbi:putative amino acid transporter [Gordonia araii NBRC 100433]|uniref:Putative amino acid transporter n=2 Tax=Gordonia araii TaxID=263909 RepID=G7H4G5_9ACTN|nr:putative amino acid transporter [Gordonia araii NBRC 100433]
MTITEPTPAGPPHPVAVDTDAGYQRGLTQRTVQMIALGGAIGIGLFYGSGAAIEKAGPALILAYLVAGLGVFVVMRALGELLMYRPVAGGISEYADEFLGRFAGFSQGWTYWAVWVTTCMAEITVAGIYINYWWPSIPVWVTALVALGALFTANLISVGVFGRAEFWFASIKIATIIGMIVIGAAVLLPIAGFGPEVGPSVTNLWNDGGFFATGYWNALLALQIVMFAYVGVELVGVTAGEAQNPRVTLRKAINAVPFRIAIFYVGALFVILCVKGWRNYREGVSPFVQVFEDVGIPGAAGIINFVLLTAALSSCNAGIYSTGRMLRSLSMRGDAPRQLSGLSSRHVPIAGIVLSAAVMVVGVVINYFDSQRAFMWIISVATVGILVVWSTIIASHLVYRNRTKKGLLPPSEYPVPGAPYTSVAALALFVGVLLLLFFTESGRTALVVGAIWFALVIIGYLIWRALMQSRAAQAGVGVTAPIAGTGASVPAAVGAGAAAVGAAVAGAATTARAADEATANIVPAGVSASDVTTEIERIADPEPAPVVPPAPAPQPAPRRLSPEEAGPEPKDNFLWAVLSCALFWPIGLFAVFKAASVKPQWQDGEYELARRSASTSRTAAVIAAVVGVVVILAVLAWLIISTR